MVRFSRSPSLQFFLRHGNNTQGSWVLGFLGPRKFRMPPSSLSKPNRGMGSGLCIAGGGKYLLFASVLSGFRTAIYDNHERNFPSFSNEQSQFCLS